MTLSNLPEVISKEVVKYLIPNPVLAFLYIKEVYAGYNKGKKESAQKFKMSK